MKYSVLVALFFVAGAICQTLRQPAPTQVPTSVVTQQNTTGTVQKTEEELADETEAHQKFLDSIDNDANPYRDLRNKSSSTETDRAALYAQCQSGLCCTKRKTFFPYGHICGQPKNDCQIAICSGQSAECYTINRIDLSFIYVFYCFLIVLLFFLFRFVLFCCCFLFF